MGLEFIDETVSGGQRTTRRTVACDVCKTVFLDGWPLGTTTCVACGVPLCVGCVPEHRCRRDEERLSLETRQSQFYDRMLPHRRRI